MSYATPGVTSIDWATKRGWKIPFNLAARAGQRTVDSIETSLKVVKIDTVTPDASASSCKASQSNGLNLIVDPLTGICRVGGTLNTNGDLFIDANDDQSTCGYTTLADGRDVILIVLDNTNTDTGLRNAQGSDGGTPFRAGDPPTPPNCLNSPAYAAANPVACAATCTNSAAYAATHKNECCQIAAWRTANPAVICAITLNRSWRQLFPRAN